MCLQCTHGCLRDTFLVNPCLSFHYKLPLFLSASVSANTTRIFEGTRIVKTGMVREMGESLLSFQLLSSREQCLFYFLLPRHAHTCPSGNKIRTSATCCRLSASIFFISLYDCLSFLTIKFGICNFSKNF